jgi:hypothetical protein
MERSQYLKSAASCSGSTQQSLKHRLNMELDPRRLFGLHVYSCTHWLRPRDSPPPHPRIWAQIRGRYWSAKVGDISL